MTRRVATFGRRRHLVAYDITDDGRRTRVFNTLNGYGRRMQYSVFVCDLSEQERIRMIWDLEDLIEPFVDRVMIVDLGDPGGRGTSCFRFLGAPPDLPTGGVDIV
ncbi:CRISPR-associated endonuclease Cas2 [Rhabdothermincola sediminis]|uniref:CRISPR-associated endonuclease Cas2 n=1 Tax=Rhabdothermincola sediminis TaxID=2751370 RepID=UPI001AA00DB4|nr:CRISPR-associated endonuclease Cas2 [Rhabdothermincola sediminis]